jgi:hypothetical protein
MTQHLRLLLGAIIITIFAAPVQAESFKQTNTFSVAQQHE